MMDDGVGGYFTRALEVIWVRSEDVLEVMWGMCWSVWGALSGCVVEGIYGGSSWTPWEYFFFHS